MNERGVTLVEALVAMAILGMSAMAVLPAFLTQLDSNTRNVERSGAAVAVQQRLEALRLQTPAGLPSSGSGAPQVLSVGDREFQVVTHYCVRPEFCNTTSRHLTVEARLEGRMVYDVQTVFTALD